ncbi:hypothetical protein RO3G_10336 [Rhizopus delemar RA 99-880]|uniref:Uncharacterized protein n=1 Tax=Rhizopus delemar (strain RA 99-880 / ATCC MYA-4621 / FGSC 9543 / NRRL 43880) TaxID=246409 RepID=I1CAZ6_RHIO9|nr:hypothetical protein RO3G_10336 [Rhizopus delemar RA 99-880]|eukprot:EIE85626.1 hypothetical protein RO3G_10336 [Rhizopus delemar RA 99-880]
MFGIDSTRFFDSILAVVNSLVITKHLTAYTCASIVMLGH